MPYEFLDDIATADVAFMASGQTQEEMFRAAADAFLNVMLPDIEKLEPEVTQTIHVQADDMEMLLFQYLQELIFLKDAGKLLLRVNRVDIQDQSNKFILEAQASGEPIDPDRHDLSVDIKAVTLHRFGIRQTNDGWEATVVLDI